MAHPSNTPCPMGHGTPNNARMQCFHRIGDQLCAHDRARHIHKNYSYDCYSKLNFYDDHLICVVVNILHFHVTETCVLGQRDRGCTWPDLNWPSGAHLVPPRCHCVHLPGDWSTLPLSSCVSTGSFVMTRSYILACSSQFSLIQIDPATQVS